MAKSPSTIAVLDIGTNSARMEIAQLRPDGSIVIVGDEKASIRLGESVFREGRIAGPVFDRGLAAIRQLLKQARSQNVDHIRAVATSALREADNGEELAARIEGDTGVHVEIITGSEEARLIHLGACEDYPGKENVLILDIGGGSTEIAVGRGASLWLASLRAGSARLTEYFINTDPPRSGELRTLETFLDNAFQSRWQDVPVAQVCLGTAGTNGAIAEMLKRDDKAFTLPNVNDLYERMAKQDEEGRRKMLGPKESGRADIILAGLAIARTFLRVSGIKEIKISSRGLRDGLLIEEAIRAGLRPHELGDARTLRRSKLLQLGDLYRFDRAHAEKVAQFAVKIFDDLKDLHGYADEERDLLEAAALLHDIGHHISYNKHHKHTYYLIHNSDMAGFDEHEVDIIANVARYHRKAAPSDRHEAFRVLPKDKRKRVLGLSAMLRLADACDRRHIQAVSDVKMKIAGESAVLRLTSPDAADVERWLIEDRSSDLFEMAYGLPVKVEVKQKPV